MAVACEFYRKATTCLENSRESGRSWRVDMAKGGY